MKPEQETLANVLRDEFNNLTAGVIRAVLLHYDGHLGTRKAQALCLDVKASDDLAGGVYGPSGIDPKLCQWRLYKLTSDAPDTLQRFHSLAADAGNLLDDWAMKYGIPAETLQRRDSLEKWLYGLFDLADSGNPRFPMRPEKRDLKSQELIEPRLRLLLGGAASSDEIAELREKAKQLESAGYWEVLDNVVRASIYAIDVLTEEKGDSSLQPMPSDWDGKASKDLARTLPVSIGAIMLGHGETFPYYSTSCEPASGDTPSVCSNAVPTLPLKYLPTVEKAFRRTGFIEADQTIHWVGDRKDIHHMCDCDLSGGGRDADKTETGDASDEPTTLEEFANWIGQRRAQFKGQSDEPLGDSGKGYLHYSFDLDDGESPPKEKEAVQIRYPSKAWECWEQFRRLLNKHLPVTKRSDLLLKYNVLSRAPALVSEMLLVMEAAEEEIRDEQPAAPAETGSAKGGGKKRPGKPPADYPTPDNYKRDKWIYEQRAAKETIPNIKTQLENNKEGWEPLFADNAIREAVKRYARYHGLKVPKGKSGRPRSGN